MVYSVPLFLLPPLLFAHRHDATCTALCRRYLLMLLPYSHLPSVTILLYCSSLLNSLLTDTWIYFHVLFSELFACISISEEKDNDFVLSKCTPLREEIATPTLRFYFFSRPITRKRCHWELHNTSKILWWVKITTIYEK